MGKGFFHFYRIIFSILLIMATSVYSQEDQSQIKKLSGIKFFQDGELSKLEFEFDRSVEDVKKFHVIEDKQIILELKNTEATDRVMRAFDTSEFSGSIVFVSAYKKANAYNDLRVVVQLRDNVRSILQRQNNKMFLIMENRFGVFSKREVDEQKIAGAERLDEEEMSDLHVPKSASINDILENLTLSGKKKYIGSRFSFNVKDMPAEDLLKMIADASGFNIITDPAIKALAPMTLKLTNVPWDHSLDLIMDLNNLVARKKGSILFITTGIKAAEEESEKIKAKAAAQSQEPLVTKIFPISYAQLADIQKITNEYLTPTRGKISPDERTNSLIVKDTAEVIEKLVKIIDALDTQTPQVLIESKLVEIEERYAKEIGLRNGVNWSYDPIKSMDKVSNLGPGFSLSSAPVEGGALLGLEVGIFGRVEKLKFNLQLMESESKGKIISSPKIITQNKKKATITETEEKPYAQTVSTDAGTTQGWASVTADLKLDVTPQVTNEGSIVMQIDIEKGSFGAAPAAGAMPPSTKRKISTNVLVDNGSTIVIGGVYTFSTNEAHSGIPFLKDLPLVGWLFRTLYNPTTSKKEMIIFLTPRIINQEEAGLIEGNKEI